MLPYYPLFAYNIDLPTSEPLPMLLPVPGLPRLHVCLLKSIKVQAK